MTSAVRLAPLSIFVACRIRALRQQQRLSQPQLAARAGLSTYYISRIERGVHSLPLKRLAVVAKALGVAPEELLRRRK